VIAEGTAEELKTRVGGERLELRVGERSRLPAAVEQLSPLGGAEPVVDQARGILTVPVTDGTRLLAEVVRRLDAAAVPIAELALRRPTLDDVFLTLTGHLAAEDEEAAGQPAGGGGPERRRRSAA
jgi:ABC-2 type transport system ATP-binding protein